MKTRRPPRATLPLLASLLLLASAVPCLGQDDPFGEVPDYVAVRAYLDQDVYHAGSEARIALELRIDPRVHVNSASPVTEFQYPTSLVWDELPPGIELSDIVWPAAELRAFEFTDGEKIDVWEGTVRARLTARIAAGAAPGARRVTGTFKAQGCTDVVCYAPQTDPVKLTIRVVGPEDRPEQVNEEKFETAAPAGGQPGGSHPEEAPPPGLPGETEGQPGGAALKTSAAAALGSGADGPEFGEECAALARTQGFDGPLPLLFLLCFLGGLALTLTPCVLPLVPITIGYFSRQREGGGRPVALAAVYVLGLALVYSALGTVAALTGNLFGSALQHPWVVGGITLILVGLALSMFGLWNLQLPAFLTGRLGGARSGYAGAAMMGGAMGLIAAPCVGPFLVTLLTYVASLGSDPTVGTGTAALLGGSLFFTLALGLGAPFFLVGVGVATINPGQWMESVKKVFGFLLLGVALWFARTLLPEGAFEIGLGVLLVATAIFLFLPVAAAGAPRLKLPFRVLGGLAGLAAVGLLLQITGLIGSTGPQGAQDFRPYTPERVQAAGAAGKPVLIDFWAEWCIACKELEHRTFSDPAVREALGDFELLSMDLTDEADPRVAQLYKSYEIRGLPTVVFLDPAGSEVRELRLEEFEAPEDFVFRVDCVESVAMAAN